MIIRKAILVRIWEEFTQDEKVAISHAMRTKIPFPAAVDLDEVLLDKPVAEKLKTLLWGSPEW